MISIQWFLSNKDVYKRLPRKRDPISDEKDFVGVRNMLKKTF